MGPKRQKNEKLLRPVHPNVGIAAEYRRRIDTLVDAMNESVIYWLRAAYRANEPEMAIDELPASALRQAVRDLARRWQRQFNEAAPKLAAWFAKAAHKRSGEALRKILKDGGFSVEFKMTRAMQDVMRATVNEQVSLIKSIPSQYFTQIEGMVMRSVTTGRDIGTLAKDIQKQYGVTKRRAALVARDQNNKATAVMTRVRQAELGITEAIWQHSGGGKEPRPTHVKNSGKRYKIAEGWLDPAEGRRVFPGELINCRCVSRSVIPGLGD
jgi:SPP1 gp7 family putative phage head morphogenesis protein